MPIAPSQNAALRGEPSYVWRAGQERRLAMIRQAAGERLNGSILEDGCGVGQYLKRLAVDAKLAIGLEIELPRAFEAHALGTNVVGGAGEHLPFADTSFDLVLSHEVLEHVQDDKQSAWEIVRVLKPGGRLVLFVPNRGYPFETHGIYWRGTYYFGNKPLVNWLPRPLRNRLAPHVRIYARGDLEKLFDELPVRIVERTIIFGAYDNIIVRFPGLGKILRAVLQFMERTPLRFFGLSHFWVVEKAQAE
ncbi:MAG TPA: class I SAM-dependent methyltransferase [Longilinea sp.]|nr:class I SAM-dependent methyltransferase [Longilinea sp.]